MINWVPTPSQDEEAVVAGYPRRDLSRLLFSKQTVMYGLNKSYNGWEGENTGGFGRETIQNGVGTGECGPAYRWELIEKRKSEEEAGGRLGKPRDTLIALPQLLVLTCREGESCKKKQPGCQSLDSGIRFSFLKNNFPP